MIKRSKQNAKIRSSFRRQLLMGWIISLFIPFFLLFVIVFIQYGDRFSKVMSGDIDFWQKNGYSIIEQVSRDINIWTNGTPQFQNHPELDDTLAKHFDEHYYNKGFILERKKEEIAPLISLSDELATEIRERFKSLDKNILPEFGERQLIANEELLTSTGYVILRQHDFYYADGEEGSIFIFIKYTNVPVVILNVLGDNILFLIIGLLLINGFMALAFVKRVTRPFNALLGAMNAYQKQDFSLRLDEKIKEPMLKTINTSVNKMAYELQQNQEKALKIENQRIEFIAKISHDIKTPLTSIHAHAEAFKDGLVQDDEKRMKYTNNILKKVQSIDNMINELSLYSDLEAGLDQYTFTKIDLNFYLIDILEELAYDYPDIQLSINYKSVEEIILLNIDVNRFNRVLMNLVKNSVKYSERDHIVIDVKLTCDLVNNYVKIIIKDNGKGIKAENLDYLFDSFTRGDTSRNPNKTGSGLGLTIAKTIVERHNGTIHINSKWNEYFEVEIKLPIGGMEYYEKNIDY